MKTTVVFYSMGGNTRLAAERIADSLGAALLEIRPKKAYPDSGLRKFLWGGKSAVMGETPALEPYSFDAESERVIFGFPVWASSVAPPLRTFIEANRAALGGKRLAAFACQAGSGGDKALGKRRVFLGAEKLHAELILTDRRGDGPDESEGQIAAFCGACR